MSDDRTGQEAEVVANVKKKTTNKKQNPKNIKGTGRIIFFEPSVMMGGGLECLEKSRLTFITGSDDISRYMLFKRVPKA